MEDDSKSALKCRQLEHFSPYETLPIKAEMDFYIRRQQGQVCHTQCEIQFRL